MLIFICMLSNTFKWFFDNRNFFYSIYPNECEHENQTQTVKTFMKSNYLLHFVFKTMSVTILKTLEYIVVYSLQ